MVEKFEDNNDFASKSINEILSILKENFHEDFKIASQEQDLHENIDFCSKNFFISARVRSWVAYNSHERDKIKSWKKYFFKDQIVIRYWVENNEYNTEWKKMLEGKGQYIFYGFRNEENTKFVQWKIGSLEILRPYVQKILDDYEEQRKHYRLDFPFKIIDNPKKSNKNIIESQGVVINISQFPNFIIYSF